MKTLSLLFLSMAVMAADEVLPDPLAAGWDGERVCERLEENDYQRMLLCTFPPGDGHERHFHVAHFGYALSGGTVAIVDSSGRREVDLPTGSHYESNGVQWHEILNIGDTTIRYLIVERKTPTE
jgi:quercetin dioxygenase-like cupin family protein